MTRYGFLFLSAALLAPPASALEDHVPLTIPPAAETARISVEAVPSRRSMRGLTRAQRAGRQAMHEGGFVEPDMLRQLAERGDGLAAQRYVRVLQADPTASASDLAFYSALAVQTGRGKLLQQMLTAMDSLDPTTEPRDRVNRYIAALYPQAWAGNAVALDAVARFNGEGRLFGALSERTRDRLLTEMRALGDGRGQLGMAVGLLEDRAKDPSGDWDQAGRVRALLQEAAASPHPGVAATAASLLTTLEAGG
ncbi:hypothetical protein JANAI62_09090 [Jannaschia pagri]|uniref:Chemotaxis protein MotC n=1 Tax=Jannaschia pagri TaxID=2829797 RepID=A0ABQ4NIQ9_9RHOB|nr:MULTISPECIES: hypothetical protein [unclassified Jannaschia]GIT89606.1 hypothetical protein JANAI61_00640 [Jannaschia sp. AI_61]GIT94286.1 hypothetical protein JANAI62_09090 [Jannaschia sp. AI_62]